MPWSLLAKERPDWMRVRAPSYSAAFDPGCGS